MLVLRTVDRTAVPSANSETVHNAALCEDGIPGMIALKLLFVLAIMTAVPPAPASAWLAECASPMAIRSA